MKEGKGERREKEEMWEREIWIWNSVFHHFFCHIAAKL